MKRGCLILPLQIADTIIRPTDLRCLLCSASIEGLELGVLATQQLAVRGVVIVFFVCFFFISSSRYRDANVSHINAVSHSALGVSGHVCEHTPTLCVWTPPCIFCI